MNMTKNAIEKTWEDFYKVKRRLKDECLEYIKDFLKEMGTDRYVFADNVCEDEFNEENGYPHIEYDGLYGTYESNVESTLLGVGMGLGGVYAITIDSSEYDAERIYTAEDFITIVDALEWCRTHKKENTEE